MVHGGEADERGSDGPWTLRRTVVGFTNVFGEYAFCESYTLADSSPQLRRELNRTLPALQELTLKESKLKKRRTGGLGVSQAFEFGERASVEYVSYF